MSYVQDSLMPKEKVLLTARIHPAILLPFIVWSVMGIVALLGGLSMAQATPQGPDNFIPILVMTCTFCTSGWMFICAAMFAIQALLAMFTTEFAVTNRRVIAKTGFIRRRTLEMLLIKVESIAVRQGILGRMLNYGTVTVTGTGGTRESFPGVVEPIVVRRKIDQIIEHYTRAQSTQPTAPGP